MKALKDLQTGDWVAIESFSRHNQRAVFLERVTGRDGDAIIVGKDRRYSDKDPFGKLGKARIPTADEITAKEADEADKAEQDRKRKEFESREGYKLAVRIARETESGNYDRLSTMPIDRLRQIVAWLEEHQKGTP